MAPQAVAANPTTGGAASPTVNANANPNVATGTGVNTGAAAAGTAATSPGVAGQQTPAAQTSPQAAGTTGLSPSHPAQVSLSNTAGAAGATTAAGTPSTASGAGTDAALVPGISSDLGVQASGSALAGAIPTTKTPFVAPSYTPITPSAPQKSNKLSSGAIGGIVGGAVGGLAFAVLVFFIWRMCRGRGEKLPPPPPRPDMQSLPRPAYGGGQSRHSSLGPRRANSYSTLLLPAPGSTYQAQQYYSSYPVASTPAFTPEQSPKFGGSLYPSGSASLSSSGTGANTPAPGATLGLGPRENSLRDGASSSDSGSGTGEDRKLRTHGSQSQLSASGDLQRPVTPSERSAMQGSSSDSRTTSPRASTVYLPSSLSSLSHGVHGRLSVVPRTPSVGVPHHRNSIVLSMPRPLSQHSLGGESGKQVVYTPRSSMARSSHRNSYQSARSYTEFAARPYSEFGAAGANSAPRSPTHASNPRRASGSFPIVDTSGGFAGSPIESPDNDLPSSRRQGHGVV